MEQIIEQAFNSLAETRKPEEMRPIIYKSCSDLMNRLAYMVNDPEETIKILTAAVILNEKDWPSWGNLAHYLNIFERFDEAAKAAEKAVELTNFVHPGTLNNYGIILTHALRFPEAIETWRKLLALNPPNAAVYHHNLGAALLMTEHYEEGWKEMEYRFAGDETTQSSELALATAFRHRFKQSFWKGEKLRKKKLAIFSEQGHGDLFQYVRFLPLVQERCKNIVMEVQPESLELMRYNFPDIEIVGRRAYCVLNDLPPNPPDCDVCISINSLPYVFGLNSKESFYSEPYLESHKQFPISIDTLANGKKKIGMCWSGSTVHGYDGMRSCYLREFKCIADIPNISLFSLQRESPVRKVHNKIVDLRARSEGVKCIDLSTYFESFSETAAAINEMDLIITIDTCVAHLAAAMGKPVWVIIPITTDWRWLLHTEKSAWYPSMRLFRHKTVNGWIEVFNRIRQEVLLLFGN